LERFIRRSEDREINKVIRRCIARPNEETTSTDVASVLGALQQYESRHPRSVVVQMSRLQRTVILVGRDLLGAPLSQKELELSEIPRSTQADSVQDALSLGPG
jgi:hypothetical protein